METTKIKELLLALNEEEQFAKEYLERTGEALNSLEKSYLFLHRDYAGQIDVNSKAFCDTLRLYAKDKGVVSENGNFIISDHVFSENADVELNYTERYIKNMAHSHKFFEIEYVLAGDCIHYVGNSVIYMSAGNIAVVPPLVPHRIELDPNSIVVNLKIRTRTFDDFFVNVFDENSCFADYFFRVLNGGEYSEYLYLISPEDKFVEDLILYMYAEQEANGQHSKRVILGLMTALFSYLVQTYEKDIKLSDTTVTVQPSEKFIAAYKYIQANYRTVTLTELAQKLYISVPYFSAQFKNHTNMTFSSYLKNVRLNAAAEMLSSESNVEHVAELVGYADSSQFIRNFKVKFGVTPKQFALRLKATNSK